MADQDIATRAPESDATEQSTGQSGQSMFPGDTPAQTGPSMGDHCTTDRPSPSGEVPTGEISKLGGVDVYIAKPADYPHSPSKLLLLLTGGTGLHSTNNQLQADKYASEGYLVVMPDQFEGDAAPNSVDMTDVKQLEPSYLEQIKFKTAETLKMFVIDMWLARHTPEKVMPILHKVIEGAKEEFADAIANGGGIYGVGYCFGAKYILTLAADHPENAGVEQAKANAPKDEEQGSKPKMAPLIKVGAIAHGTMITVEDFEAVKSPVYVVAVKDDPLMSEEDVLTPGLRALEKNKVEHDTQTFPDVPHGFAVLGDYEDPKIKQSQEQAFGQMLGWLKSH